MKAERPPFRRRLSLRFYLLAMRALAWATLKIAGDGMGLLPDLFSTAQGFVQPMKAKAAEAGRAREYGQFEGLMQQLAQSIRPDSQWVHHDAEWGVYRVVVMPRVIDSNTGVVIGPKESPDLGSVVTNDGQPPNCDPAALNFILNGPGPIVPPAHIDAEFLDGPDAV